MQQHSTVFPAAALWRLCVALLFTETRSSSRRRTHPAENLGPVTTHVKMSRHSFSHTSVPPPTFSHLPSSLTWKTLPSQRPGRRPVNEDSGNERRQHSGRREGTRMGGRHLCVCLYVILLGVSGVAELSGPDPKMNDDGEGDDVWVELLPVQLVDTHRARFLEGRKKPAQ